MVVDQEADILLAGESMPLAKFTVTRGSEDPLGALATLHARAAPQGRAWISLGVCGGTLLGMVPQSALLGPSRDVPWRLGLCLDRGQKTVAASPELERPLRCDRDLTLYLRQLRNLDVVGNVKAGAPFQIEGARHDGRVFVTFADAPVELARGMSCFELRESDVRQHCR